MGKLRQFWSLVHGIMFPCIVSRPGLVVHFRNTESPLPNCKGTLHTNCTLHTNESHDSQV